MENFTADLHRKRIEHYLSEVVKYKAKHSETEKILNPLATGYPGKVGLTELMSLTACISMDIRHQFQKLESLGLISLNNMPI